MPNTVSYIDRYRFLSEVGCHLASASPKGLRASEIATAIQHCYRGHSRKELIERIWQAVDEGDLEWCVDGAIRLHA